jgi:hypothetical protein
VEHVITFCESLDACGSFAANLYAMKYHKLLSLVCFRNGWVAGWPVAEVLGVRMSIVDMIPLCVKNLIYNS